MGVFTKISSFINSVTFFMTGRQKYQRVETNGANPPSNTFLKGRFRSHKWDPMLITSQIIAMQCIFYTTMGLIIASLTAIIGETININYIFRSDNVHFQSRSSQIIVISHVLNSICGALALWCVIQRAKQCLDFTCTLHLFHLITCWIYTGTFPLNITWWLVNVSCIVLMVVIGEYLCFRTDLRDIPVMGARADV